MENSDTQLVKFNVYCKHCTYFNIKETEEPCNSCLEEGGREQSHIPARFDKWDKISRRPRS